MRGRRWDPCGWRVIQVSGCATPLQSPLEALRDPPSPEPCSCDAGEHSDGTMTGFVRLTPGNALQEGAFVLQHYRIS